MHKKLEGDTARTAEPKGIFHNTIACSAYKPGKTFCGAAAPQQSGHQFDGGQQLFSICISCLSWLLFIFFFFSLQFLLSSQLFLLLLYFT